MKKMIKMTIWILISLILQFAVLFYFSNYYKNNKSIIYKWNNVPIKKKRTIQVNIPTKSQNIKVSSTGNFVSYYLGNSIHVIDINKNKDNTIKLNTQASDTSISWRSNDDKLMVIEKKYSEIEIYTYDPNENKLTRDFDINNKVRSYTIGNNYNITDIQQNDKNTLIYLKITENNSLNYSFLKKLDISNDIKTIDLPIHSIGNYFIFKAENKVIFEDNIDNEIYITSNTVGTDEWHTEQLRIPGVTGLKLLDVDDNGVVYVGKLINNKIITIYTCNISTGDNSNKKTEIFNGNWNKILLKNEIDPNLIYISSIGDIFDIDDINKNVLNIKNGEKTLFIGKYVCMFGDSNGGGIISLNGNNLVETMLK